MEKLLFCQVHRKRPVEYVCPNCENLRMCEECKRGHVSDEGRAPENCKEVGQRLMHQRIQDAGGQQAKELAKGLRKGLNELESGLMREIDRFQSSLVQTDEQRKMQKLNCEERYAELYFYAKSLPAVGANNKAATEELNKRLLKILDTAYEGLQNVRNKIAAGAGETLAEKMDKELRELRRDLHNNEESLRKCLAACDASWLKESIAAIGKQHELQKKDIMTKMEDCLNAVENGFDSALAKFNAQLGTRAANVREFRRVLNAKSEEVKKRIAEEEEEKEKPLSVEKGECARN